MAAMVPDMADRFLPVVYTEKWQRQPGLVESSVPNVDPAAKIDGVWDPISGTVKVNRAAHRSVLRPLGFCVYNSSSMRFGESRDDNQKLLPDSGVEVSSRTSAVDEESVSKRRRVDTESLCEERSSAVELSAVESFYCQYVLGRLRVSTAAGEVLDCQSQWWAHCRAVPAFVPCFVAYCYLRQNGWVVMAGLSFGVDFLAYRGGPELYHSSYCVKVRVSAEGGGGGEREAGSLKEEDSLSCRELSSLQRVAEGGGKLLMLVDVVPPQWWRGTCGPCSLPAFAVRETVVRRWRAGRERAGAT